MSNLHNSICWKTVSGLLFICIPEVFIQPQLVTLDFGEDTKKFGTQMKIAMMAQAVDVGNQRSLNFSIRRITHTEIRKFA